MIAASSRWNPAGVAAVWAIAPVVLLVGLVVVRDWRGLGTKYYKLARFTDIFGFYKSGGYPRFRLWAGWFPIAFAALLFAIGIAGAVSLLL